MRKKYTNLIVILTLFFNSSCITDGLKEHSTYWEYFYEYFISERGNQIVFVSEKYHYIFKNSQKQIKEFIKPEWQGKVGIKKIDLKVEEYNKVHGSVTLLLRNPSEQQKSSLKKNNKNAKFNGGNVSIEIKLQGIRYKPARGFEYQRKFLTKRYEAKIVDNSGFYGKLRFC